VTAGLKQTLFRGCLVTGHGQPRRRFGSATPVWREEWPPHATPLPQTKRQTREENDSCGSQSLHSNQAAAKVAELLAWQVAACNQTHP